MPRQLTRCPHCTHRPCCAPRARRAQRCISEWCAVGIEEAHRQVVGGIGLQIGDLQHGAQVQLDVGHAHHLHAHERVQAGVVVDVDAAAAPWPGAHLRIHHHDAVVTRAPATGRRMHVVNIMANCTRPPACTTGTSTMALLMCTLM